MSALEQLKEDGFYFANGLLADEGLAAATAVAMEGLRRQGEPLYTVGLDFNKLTAFRDAIVGFFTSMGVWDDGVFDGSYLVNKMPKEVRRPWHQDWRWWNHQLASRPLGVQFGVLLYISPSNWETGCTQVLPGTHLKPSRHWGFDFTAPVENATDIIAGPGDALIFDSRVCHASRQNSTGENRMAIVAWAIPNRLEFEELAGMPYVPYPPQESWK